MLLNKILLKAAIAAAAFSVSLSSSAEIFSTDSYALGTLINSKFKEESRDKADQCARIVWEETKRLEELLSAYIPTSDISKLGEHAGQWVDVSPDTAQILEDSIRIAKETHGTFDPTVGAIVKLWNVDQKTARVPSDQEISDALKFVGYDQMGVRKTEHGWQAKIGKGQQITVGAIGKGFISDKVIQRLKENGCNNSLISLGGNIIANGTNAQNQPWRIGLQEPEQTRGAYFAVVPVADTSVVTSGDYEKFFIKDGVKYHHILNPKTGRPVPATLSSVSIVNPSSTTADALCTALFVMGWDGAVDYLKKHPDLQAVLVSEDRKRIGYTKNLQGIIDFTDPSYEIQVLP